jgi:hypothetical protein
MYFPVVRAFTLLARGRFPRPCRLGRCAQPTLNQRPEVLKPVGVDFAAHIFYRMVNHFMPKLVKPLVGFQGASKQCGTGKNALADFRLQSFFLGVAHNLSANLAAAL